METMFFLVARDCTGTLELGAIGYSGVCASSDIIFKEHVMSHRFDGRAEVGELWSRSLAAVLKARKKLCPIPTE